MVRHDPRLSVLLVIALLICFVHALQLKHIEKDSALKTTPRFVWLSGAVFPAIYSLPSSGISSSLDGANLIGPGRKGRAIMALEQAKNRKSYVVSSEGEVRVTEDAYAAAPFFYLPIPLNRTDAKTLMAIPGIGTTLSAKIISYRNAHGSFRSVEELLRVNGVGEKKLAEMRKQLVVDR